MRTLRNDHTQGILFASPPRPIGELDLARVPRPIPPLSSHPGCTASAGQSLLLVRAITTGFFHRLSHPNRPTPFPLSLDWRTSARQSPHARRRFWVARRGFHDFHPPQGKRSNRRKLSNAFGGWLSWMLTPNQGPPVRSLKPYQQLSSTISYPEIARDPRHQGRGNLKSPPGPRAREKSSRVLAENFCPECRFPASRWAQCF